MLPLMAWLGYPKRGRNESPSRGATPHEAMELLTPRGLSCSMAFALLDDAMLVYGFLP